MIRNTKFQRTQASTDCINTGACSWKKLPNGTKLLMVAVNDKLVFPESFHNGLLFLSSQYFNFLIDSMQCKHIRSFLILILHRELLALNFLWASVSNNYYYWLYQLNTPWRVNKVHVNMYMFVILFVSWSSSALCIQWCKSSLVLCQSLILNI